MISISNIRRKIFIITALLMLTLSLVSCNLIEEYKEEKVEFQSGENDLLVHFIDVGQGDSTLVELPNKEIALIDGGPRSSSDKLLQYLRKNNINRIDYLIATHPHEDHIGGLSDVIKSTDIGKVYMPERIANTETFKYLLNTIKNKDLKIDIVKSGDIVIDEEGLKFYFLAPVKTNYENTNDFSIVTKIEYGNNSLLIMGDAEAVSERDILKSDVKLKSDVLRVGHHGSSTSSTEKFVKAVNATDYVISLGIDNSYGHPHREVLKIINDRNGNIYRTDKMGDIKMSSDGNTIVFNKDNSSGKEKIEGHFIGNKNTKIFHIDSCNSLPKKDNQIEFTSINNAIENGYNAHSCVK